eukprot:9609694-Alexandrium_andersonii.AAC.1
MSWTFTGVGIPSQPCSKTPPRAEDLGRPRMGHPRISPESVLNREDLRSPAVRAARGRVCASGQCGEATTRRP